MDLAVRMSVPTDYTRSQFTEVIGQAKFNIEVTACQVTKFTGTVTPSVFTYYIGRETEKAKLDFTQEEDCGYPFTV